MIFVNISGTAKKLWLGVRLLRTTTKQEVIEAPILDVNIPAIPVSEITGAEMAPIQ